MSSETATDPPAASEAEKIPGTSDLAAAVTATNGALGPGCSGTLRRSEWTPAFARPLGPRRDLYASVILGTLR